MPDDFLDLMLIRRSTSPCAIRKTDLLELMHRAGLADTHVADVVRASTEERLTVDQVGVREMIRMARERETRGQAD